MARTHRTPQSFKVALNSWSASTEARARATTRAFMQTVASEIIVGGSFGPGTPVDTGFARASWVFGVGAAPTSPGMGPGGVQSAIAAAPLGPTWVLANHTPYIRALEYGHSKQAPQGMVRVVVRKSKLIFKLVADMVRAVRPKP